MKIGRLRKLVLSLFLLATVASALHTLEHHHHHETCPVCTVTAHTAAPDVVAAPQEPFFFRAEALPAIAARSSGFIFYRSTSTRAPPSPV